jgi:NAD(P)-dependent dehydrogenase (short-subunit alcohol dehydrogenase family)
MGKATAELFGREGANVVVANRNVERGKATANAIKTAGGEAAFVQYDQAKGEAEIKRMVEESIAAFGHIDILHNHAGTLDFKRDGPLHTVTEERRAVESARGPRWCGVLSRQPSVRHGRRSRADGRRWLDVALNFCNGIS